MAQATETAEIVRSIKDEVAVNVLTNAVEGGIGYWAGMSDSSRDADLMYTSITVYDMEEIDADGNPEDPKTITGKEIRKAIKKIAKGGVVHKDMTKRISKLTSKNAEVIDEALCEIDALDCDVIVQVAAFGEVVFG